VGHFYLRNNLLTQTLEHRVVTGLILPAVVNEFQFNGLFLKFGQNVGTCFLGSRGEYLGMQVRIYLNTVVIQSTQFLDRISSNITLSNHRFIRLGGRWITELSRSELASGVRVSWGR
jgi:hypothetical protein